MRHLLGGEFDVAITALGQRATLAKGPNLNLSCTKATYV
jgi:hypothetical protein